MNQERIYKVLLGPHVSEKASLAAERGQVVFRVAPDATKPEIKAAVEPDPAAADPSTDA